MVFVSATQTGIYWTCGMSLWSRLTLNVVLKVFCSYSHFLISENRSSQPFLPMLLIIIKSFQMPITNKFYIQKKQSHQNTVLILHTKKVQSLSSNATPLTKQIVNSKPRTNSTQQKGLLIGDTKFTTTFRFTIVQVGTTEGVFHVPIVPSCDVRRTVTGDWFRSPAHWTWER